MARIRTATLSITPAMGTGIVVCEVTGELEFTPYELNELEEGLTFSLEGELWGEDYYLHEHPEEYPDLIWRRMSRTEGADRLVTLPRRTISGAGSSPRSYRLAKSVRRTALEEDEERTVEEDWVTTDTDEIYAVLTLTNTYTQVSTTRTSNMVRLHS